MKPAILMVAGLVRFGLSAAALPGDKVYRHVDDKGKVTFTDLPEQRGEAKVVVKKANVASPEARRQLYVGRADMERV